MNAHPSTCRRAAAVAVVAAVVAAGVSPAASAATSGDRDRPSFTLGSPDVVATGLANPYALEWGPRGELWMTEKSGLDVVAVNPSTGAKRILATLDDATYRGQAGVLGLALEPSLVTRGFGSAYVSYTYDSQEADRVTGETLRTRVVRYAYDRHARTLVHPETVIEGLPGGTDHQAAKLQLGPDGKLYVSLGDQGANQFAAYLNPNWAQRLPTAAEVAAGDWYEVYQGKTLRLETDGSVPADNPVLDGVRSHVYTYGHRNPQGLEFTAKGALLSSEHGPKTDDEVNVLAAGANYGWPRVAGYQDDAAYAYRPWAEADPAELGDTPFSDYDVPEAVPAYPESGFAEPFTEPALTFGTVEEGHDFLDPACGALSYICWPTVAPSSVESYDPIRGHGVPGWERSVLVPTLKDGSIYRLQLNRAQDEVVASERVWRGQDRYRDVAVSPDGRTVYAVTDSSGLVRDADGVPTSELTQPGSLVALDVVPAR
ncbi:PQQ-dependent sugar dehydrogenase [Isoptericola hypogeus]|uniref:PQQ-dependent sugar dehydrogenase n=1 Tax=Isoptericola hypogeus TaxID=300179 RepID=A0ABN2JH16_9MICO